MTITPTMMSAVPTSSLSPEASAPPMPSRTTPTNIRASGHSTTTTSQRVRAPAGPRWRSRRTGAGRIGAARTGEPPYWGGCWPQPGCCGSCPPYGRTAVLRHAWSPRSTGASGSLSHPRAAANPGNRGNPAGPRGSAGIRTIKVRLDCFFVRRRRWPGDRHPGSPGGAHPRHAPAPAGGLRRVPGRARLERHLDHAGLASGPGSAGAPSCTTSRPRTTWSSPPSTHLSEVRGAELEAAAAALPTGRAPHPRGAGDARRPLHRTRSSPPRSSCGSRPAPTPQLHEAVAPLEQRLGREMHRHTVELLGVDESRPGARELVQATLDLVRGLGLANTISDDRARRGRILDQWAAHPRRRPARRPRDRQPRRWSPCSPTSPPRATGSTRWSPGSTTPAGVRRPRPRAGTSPPRSPTSPGPTRRSVAAATDKAAWDALVLEAIADPEGFVDEAALARRAGDAAPSCSPAGAPSRPRWPRRCASVPEGEKLPWYGPPMSPTSMATARFMETWAHGLDVARGARRRARADRPAPARRAPRRPHPRLRLRRARPAGAGRGVPGRARPRRPARPWTWGPEDAAQRVTGSAYDFCLLVTQRGHRDDLDLVADR